MRPIPATIRLMTLLAILALAAPVLAGPSSAARQTAAGEQPQAMMDDSNVRLTPITLIYESDVRGKVEPCG
jgi:hypothetical protein